MKHRCELLNSWQLTDLKFFFLACFSFSLSILPNSAFCADEEALTFDSLGTGSDYYQGTYSLGWRFKANSNIRVTALGFYDDLRNGLAASHEVGIYEVDTCNLVVSTTVQPSDPLEGTGFFRYHSVTPVTLTSGKDYYVAAVTNGYDDYAIAVSTMVANAALNYWGFAIYGNTQTTSTLQCPNGSAQQGFKGDYGPNFKFGDSSGGGGDTPTPTPTGTSNNKKTSKIKLFCNRKGSSLEIASCTASVADASTSLTKTTPTGTVDFVATDGFSPGSASCSPTKTDYTGDGIVSCTVEFQIPNGFPIGTKFPIEASYSGDANFNPSSTSHTLIEAKCIGTSEKPCSGAVALSFTDKGLQIIKSALALAIGCGTSAGSREPLTIPSDTLASSALVGCDVRIGTSGELAKMLYDMGLTPEMCGKISDEITNSDANTDALLKGIKDMFKKANNDPSYLPSINISPEALNSELLKYIKKAQQQQQKRSAPLVRPSQRYRTLAAKKMKVVTFGSTAIRIKENLEKTTKLRLNNFGKKFTRALKKAGLSSISLNFTLKSTRIGKVPDGVSKKVSAEQSLDVTF